MAPRRVLVTGVSRYLGEALARQLSDDPSIEAVVGVDTHPPRDSLGRADFVRADIRNPLIARVITAAEVDTVVHTNVLASSHLAGGRAAMKEVNVIGTMQLLAACQKAPSLRTLVLKSTAAVYGRSPRDPAVLTEEMEPRALPVTGYAKDAVEVEGYVRGFGRRRPDVALTVLRFSNFIGPRIDSTLTRYFGLGIAPTLLGSDPRLQMIHEDDALAVLRLAADGERPGVFNVAGDGVLMLSQALRRLGRPSVPLPAPASGLVRRALRLVQTDVLTPEQMSFLGHGRVVDTTALRTAFGFTPAYSTSEAFEDYATAHPGPLRSIPVPVLAAAASLADRRRAAHA
ncbi:MAG TPA: NAD-dependent epimerase/dehydratase family protein [Mycobacteriales bacterium]